MPATAACSPFGTALEATTIRCSSLCGTTAIPTATPIYLTTCAAAPSTPDPTSISPVSAARAPAPAPATPRATGGRPTIGCSSSSTDVPSRWKLTSPTLTVPPAPSPTRTPLKVCGTRWITRRSGTTSPRYARADATTSTTASTPSSRTSPTTEANCSAAPTSATPPCAPPPRAAGMPATRSASATHRATVAVSRVPTTDTAPPMPIPTASTCRRAVSSRSATAPAPFPCPLGL